MADTSVTPSTFNARIVALRFFFSMTCGREEMKRYMQFRTEPRKLPIVLSIEEVSALLATALGPGLKYRAALGFQSELVSLSVKGDLLRKVIKQIPNFEGIHANSFTTVEWLKLASRFQLGEVRIEIN